MNYFKRLIIICILFSLSMHIDAKDHLLKLDRDVQLTYAIENQMEPATIKRYMSKKTTSNLIIEFEMPIHSSIFEYNISTFEPVSYLKKHGSRSETIAYLSPTSVNIVVNDSTKKTTKKWELTSSIREYLYYPSYMFPYALDFIQDPIKKNYEVLSFLTSWPWAIKIKLDYIGKETIKIQAGSFDAHNFKISFQNENANHIDSLLWVSIYPPHYLLKYEGNSPIKGILNHELSSITPLD